MDSLLMKILGASLRGVVGGFVSGVAGQFANIPSSLLTAGIGYYLYKYQHGNTKDFGEGLLISSVADFIAPMVQGFIPQAGAQAGAGAGTTTQAGAGGVKQVLKFHDPNGPLTWTVQDGKAIGIHGEDLTDLVMSLYGTLTPQQYAVR